MREMKVLKYGNAIFYPFIYMKYIPFFTNRTYQEFVIVTAYGIKWFSKDFFSLVDSII
jgi:hypothetical protein